MIVGQTLPNDVGIVRAPTVAEFLSVKKRKVIAVVEMRWRRDSQVHVGLRVLMCEGASPRTRRPHPPRCHRSGAASAGPLVGSPSRGSHGAPLVLWLP